MRALFVAALGLALVGCSSKDKSPKKRQERPAPARPEPSAPEARDAAAPDHVVSLPPAPPIPQPPLGLPEAPVPAHNPLTPEKVALGEILFFDERLSSNRSMACATCHQPERGWASGEPRCRTVAGKPNLRHTPTLVNVAYAKELFWDGRMSPLEPAIDAHWHGQMGADPGAVATRLGRVPHYRAHFGRAFGAAPSGSHIVEALAAFVRTIRSGNAAFDRYEVEGDASTVPASAVAGAKVFAQKAQCALCHPPPLYTDFAYHVPADAGPTSDAGALQPSDIGRALVTKNEGDNGAFKTPTLRDVVRSAPYFHDGSAASLEDAVARCLARGGPQGYDGASPLQPAHLTREEVDQLIAFLQALTPERKPYSRPDLPREPPPPAPTEPSAPATP